MGHSQSSCVFARRLPFVALSAVLVSVENVVKGIDGPGSRRWPLADPQEVSTHLRRLERDQQAVAAMADRATTEIVPQWPQGCWKELREESQEGKRHTVSVGSGSSALPRHRDVLQNVLPMWPDVRGGFQSCFR